MSCLFSSMRATRQATSGAELPPIIVHHGAHSAVAGVAVTGLWNDGTRATCTTAADGRCAVIRSGLQKTANARFSVSNLTHATLVYQSTDNYDPDGDSTGSAITVTRR